MRRALIAEDEPAMSRAIRRALETELGHSAAGSGAGMILDVEEAATAAGALLAVRERPPDVIVADVGMFAPGELAALIREARERRRPGLVYALIVSGMSDDELASASWSAAPNDWLPKPFSVAAIVAKVRGGIGAITPHR